ncbi:MAG: hydroxylamine reductase [Deltaproteobacteria bacterium]|jgi:hydroxylamine reductase|nr:hydroxylamine reductase [Deltaproteobacteria bacterium]
MEEKMFCMQCEQTAGGKACVIGGVCGKTPDTARLQDRLTGALIAASRGGGLKSDKLLLEGLFCTLTNVNFNDGAIERLIKEAGDEHFDLKKVKDAGEDVRSLKTLLLLGCRGVAAYAYHCLVLGYDASSICAFLRKALSAVGEDGYGLPELVPLLMECGQVNIEALALLDKANNESFGVPCPTVVSRVLGPGPFIVVSGHDLLDLKLVLEQTQGRGVSVYTHGEMLPAHAYPELNKHPHLKGHFGTAWQNQQKEFAGVPGAFLFTSNCLMPPKPSYSDRVFTTAAAGFPGLSHIGREKDFSLVIAKAVALGGYTASHGEGSFTTGFGHSAVLRSAGQVIEAVKTGAIKRFLLVGGCDGARLSRGYFADFVKLAPKDAVILTLGCGKYRFNHLDLGEIGGLPRLMDMGQCNDAYSAVKVALALAEAFKCGLNDLPLTLVLSWYEQKAVAILLSLLRLGIKSILLGPTLPAFVSPNVLNYLVENFSIGPTTTPEADLSAIFGAGEESDDGASDVEDGLDAPAYSLSDFSQEEAKAG